MKSRVKIKIAVASLCCITLLGCTDPTGARSALLDAGYTQITVTGFKAFMCGQDDQVSTGFEAIGPTGRHVSGAVCEGLAKGKTIRLN